MALGRWYAGSKSAKPDTRGVPEELKRQIDVAHKDDNNKLEIYADNMPAFTVFLDMAGQWNIHGFSGIYLGIHRPSIEYSPTWRKAAEPERLDILDKLAILERSAKAEMNKRQEQRNASQ